jgi:TP901-1 family phage major tail protein
MSKKTGTDVTVLVSTDDVTYTLIANQSGGTLNREGAEAECTNKDSNRNKEALPNIFSWSVSVSGFHDEADAGAEIVRTALMGKTTIYGKFLEANGAKTHKGQVNVTSHALEAPVDGVVTYAIELAGTGALSIA